VARQSGLSVTQAALEETTFPEESFDAITLHHVVEHLHDPVGTLRICRKILRPGGLISVVTPNFRSRGSVIFGRDWYALAPPFHLVVFTENSLRGALEQTAFRDCVAHASSFVAESIFTASAKLAAESGAPLQEEWCWRIQRKLANLLGYFGSVWWVFVVMTARKSDQR
jgi:SAM-dependent methyltransferase